LAPVPPPADECTLQDAVLEAERAYDAAANHGVPADLRNRFHWVQVRVASAEDAARDVHAMAERRAEEVREGTRRVVDVAEFVDQQLLATRERELAAARASLVGLEEKIFTESAPGTVAMARVDAAKAVLTGYYAAAHPAERGELAAVATVGQARASPGCLGQRRGRFWIRLSPRPPRAPRRETRGSCTGRNEGGGGTGVDPPARRAWKGLGRRRRRGRGDLDRTAS